MPARRSSPLGRVAGPTAVLLVAAGVVACTGDGGASPTSPPSTVTSTTEPVRVDDGILKIGLLLPQSGEGATIGQPLIEAAELARDRINAAGGVGGRDLEMVEADEGASPAAAMDAVSVLREQDVDAVIGPASSTIALATLDDLLEQGILTCSPTATALALDAFPRRSELFFRTAPSDSLQAAAMAQLAEQTGAQTIAVAYLDDVYGRPLALAVIDALQARRLTITSAITYRASDQNLVDQATAIGESQAGVVIVIGDAEQGTRMLTAIGENAGRFGQAPPDIIVNDAIRRPPSPQLIQSLPSAVRQRIEGVSPTALPQRPEEPAGPFATNAYDCVNLIALASAQAASDAPAEMAAQLSEVSARGQPCAEYDECLDLLADDRNIDYQGPGGVVQIGPAGDPERARFDTFEFGANGADRTDGSFTITG